MCFIYLFFYCPRFIWHLCCTSLSLALSLSFVFISDFLLTTHTHIFHCPPSCGLPPFLNRSASPLYPSLPLCLCHSLSKYRLLRSGYKYFSLVTLPASVAFQWGSISLPLYVCCCVHVWPYVLLKHCSLICAIA